MDTKKLDKWANLLLDTGKRNNLINFHDTKSSTVEVIFPDAEELFEKVDSSASFEVFDPKIADEEEGGIESDTSENSNGTKDSESQNNSKLDRQGYIDTFSGKIKKKNQILLYNSYINPVNAIKNIDKKARGYIEETGVNVAYIAFGFIHWKESETSQIICKAPILLAPITFSNDSAISPWFINMTDEDVIVNPTFSYKLANEFDIKLPEYGEESLLEYLNKIEQIIAKLGWAVSRDVKIGIFSFLKMNMYKDVTDNKDTILQNNNVRMLLGEEYEPLGMGGDAESQKIENPLVELHNVVDADSSQIDAIEKAKSGQSFVLQGPPGTGKSQTITNIIAECINDGKKVLFVSEKQAALNVVYNKLKKAGLEEFCLELHSYKSNKKDVIAELCKTLRTNPTNVSSKANHDIELKVNTQRKLDQYEEELHKPREVINRSLYQLYDAFSATRNATDVKVSISGISSKGEDYLREALNLLNQYVDYIPSVGYQYTRNPWYGYINQDTSYQMREDMRACIASTTQALQEFLKIQNHLDNKYEISCRNIVQSSKVGDILALAANSNVLTPSFFNQDRCDFLMAQLTKMSVLGAEIVKIRDSINQNYDSEIYELDAADANKRLTRQFTSGLTRLFNSEYKSLISNIRINNKTGSKPSYDEAIKLTADLSIFHEKSLEFETLEKEIAEDVGSEYVGVDSNWKMILSHASMIKVNIRNCEDFKSLANLSKSEYENSKQDFSNTSASLKELKNKNNDNIELIKSSFDKNIFDIENWDFDKALEKLELCLCEYEKIDNWCRFRDLLYKINDKQLVSYIDEAIKNNVPAVEIVKTFERNFYRQWIDYILHQSSELASFSRIEHDKDVKDFSQLDEVQFAISKAQIKSELSRKRPSLDFAAAGSAVSLLLREGEKKRKQKSIRTLMEEAGELIQKIKPCFLMSPLSVSTFLSSEAIRFDVVVFDEASQIFPQDALGAIYRGKQLIVVGDSKQMPPSNFFNAINDNDEDDEETGDITDFESILDLCSTSLPQLRLRWHYRSRYEQLIAFSNKNFYDNDLVTFPSSATNKQWIGVDYYFAGGTYDHKSRSNRIEAEYIVDLIYENIEKYPNRSLGVVAFSISQQDLIDRLLSKRRFEDPSKEFFFKRDVEEPFFIKNLETVQGDERDTIIFSVAYARDNTGRLMHNFGPLNRMGGERRLNVAVSRAKMNVQLVASIHCIDIDLTRTKSEGARLLREYLDYAENGEIALERSISANPYEQFDSEFEMEVRDFLADNGFTVDTQVGCSNFKIDLGLRKPNTSDYVLAIECDGATYHSSKNARDRDRLRQQILEGMGWKFYRIWSTDWFKNMAVEKERLLAAAKAAVKNDSIDSDNEVIEKDGDIQDLKLDFEEEQKNHMVFPSYNIFHVNYYQSQLDNLQSFVYRILTKEAPLSEDWLLRRIVWMFGREKVTNVVQETYENKMRGCELVGIIRRNGFLYLKGQNKYMLRVPIDEETKRDVKHIALEELAAGMLFVIRQNVTVDKDGLYKLIASKLGFQRVADAMRRRFDEALKLIKNQIEINGNEISMKSR